MGGSLSASTATSRNKYYTSPPPYVDLGRIGVLTSLAWDVILVVRVDADGLVVMLAADGGTDGNSSNIA